MLKLLLKLLECFFNFLLQRNSPEQKEERKRDEIEREHDRRQREIEAAAGGSVGDFNRLTADVLNRHDDVLQPDESGFPGRQV